MDQSSLIERLTRILDSSPWRWHRRADEPREIVFVLDDGTGDVELRFSPPPERFAAQLVFRGRTTDSFIPEPSSRVETSAGAQALSNWIAQSLNSLKSGIVRERNQSRFMVAFEPEQLEALREFAAERNIPVAEAVRQAVSQYLKQDD